MIRMLKLALQLPSLSVLYFASSTFFALTDLLLIRPKHIRHGSDFNEFPHAGASNRSYQQDSEKITRTICVVVLVCSARNASFHVEQQIQSEKQKIQLTLHSPRQASLQFPDFL